MPHFHVLRHLVEYVRAHPEDWPGSQARELRAYACTMQQKEKRGLLGRLPAGGPAGDGTLKGWLLGRAWTAVTWHLPRWWWARWTSRRVMRGWLAALPVAGGGVRNLYAVLDQIAAVQATRLQNDPLHEEALQALEDLLVRALLEDLRRPRVGRLLPKRRRRVARPVLLVELPPSGAVGARAAERFLVALCRARETTPGPGPLVIAVGQPSATLLGVLGDPPESNFTQAALQLGGGEGHAVLVGFSDDALRRPGIPVRPVPEPAAFRLSWRTTTALLASATVLALLGGGVAAYELVPADRSCVGGEAPVAGSLPGSPGEQRTDAWYTAARRAIEAENARAERFAAEGRTVRTVVAFESEKAAGETEALFDGTIPELRGIALWQRQLNDDAVADSAHVPLRVDVRTTGVHFAHAERAARDLVARVRDEKAHGRGSYERVVGVLGFAQSREETRKALGVLGAAGIPVIGTTATADEMLEGAANRTYWPLSPLNSTEARIGAAFASGENIVERRASGGGCTPARQAVVIESAADVYSSSLARKFRSAFPGRTRTVNFDQDGDFAHRPPGVPSIRTPLGLMDELCGYLREEPRSVVYWAARARDFAAFVNAADDQGTCLEHDVTVLGGDELTNVAMNGLYSDKHWLRLYYSAHRVPVTDPRASDRTRRFGRVYDAFVRATTDGPDPWGQDAHAAVAFDAFHVLSQAVDRARVRDEAVGRGAVLASLDGGVDFDGATGYIRYGRDRNAPPVGRTLVLLRQLAREPRAVVVCGAYAEREKDARQAEPCVD